jgi:multisubunit Na+/H+ antiporter MnhG subunit
MFSEFVKTILMLASVFFTILALIIRFKSPKTKSLKQLITDIPVILAIIAIITMAIVLEETFNVNLNLLTFTIVIVCDIVSFIWSIVRIIKRIKTPRQ